MYSVWGVDHGEYVSKALPTNLGRFQRGAQGAKVALKRMPEGRRALTTGNGLLKGKASSLRRPV